MWLVSPVPEPRSEGGWQSPGVVTQSVRKEGIPALVERVRAPLDASGRWSLNSPVELPLVPRAGRVVRRE